MRDHLLTRRQFAVAAGTLAATIRRPSIEAAADAYVVNASWLQAQRASDPNLVILDTSSLSTYHDGHIKSAVHCWWQDTMEWNNPTYGTTLMTGGPGSHVQLLQDLGVSNSSFVVAYDDEDNRWAARLVYFLRWLSHDAAILDGGLDAWRTANGAVESGSNSPIKRGIPTISARSSILIETNRLTARLKSGKSQLVDIRTPEEARDNVNGASKIGVIPGSISLPWTSLVEKHRLKTADQINALLSKAGITPSKPVILYGRYGVETDQPWVVLKSLGYGDVSVYDLGFAGWQADPNLPVGPLPANEK